MSEDVLFPRLVQSEALTREAVGGKAAALSALASAGFPVPAGFVVTRAALEVQSAGPAGTGPAAKLRAAAAATGPGPFAVRSSAVAEDLPGASFAGMYESYLEVTASGLEDAVRKCFASAEADRVQVYQSAVGSESQHQRAGMAVLVQQMVDPAAAGVAFTANPLTGTRDETVISAVSGLAEGLVSGVDTGEEWTVRSGRAALTRGTGAVLSREWATAVAAAAGNVAAHFGCPQDIEWAVDRSGGVYILQARPMTALPDPVSWDPPGQGAWLRNFRLGEWLPEPVTPLFMDWVIPGIDAAYNEAAGRSVGVAVPMGHGSVNGWYYVAPPSPRALPRLLFRGKPRSLPYFFNLVVRPMFDPQGADKSVLRGLEAEWRTHCLPAYRLLASASPGPATLEELERAVEQVARAAGEYLWYFAATGGAAWKMELALARFWRRHLAKVLDGHTDAGKRQTDGYQVLLGGLSPTLPDAVPHAVYSLDWYHKTAGEEPGGVTQFRHSRIEGPSSPPAAAAALRRRDAETACRAALSDSRLRNRFDKLLSVAQHYALLREEQSRDFTLGWPLLRRSALGIGRYLSALGIIDAPEDVFFLARDALGPDTLPQQRLVERRREEWQRQRKLVAPLSLGKLPPLIGNTFDRAANSARSTRQVPAGALLGHPASPGRAQGRVRLVDGPEEFSLFQPGEILVAKATAPAWTPLFAHAAAVVTDGGNFAAHASLVAREYGIPAVVGTGNATQLLSTGQLVTVDGSAGIVETHNA